VIEDVRPLGLETIREYLPRIVLPRRVREFWECYVGQVEGGELRHRGAITAPSDEGIEPGDERLDIHREGADFL